MKKWILILLLAILPLQYSWAAAAVYCQHEEKATAHFGHHTHHHDAASEPGQAKEKASTLKVDSDCQVCHLAAQASFLSDVPPLQVLSGEAHQADPPPRYSSHSPARPIPPDWHFVA